MRFSILHPFPFSPQPDHRQRQPIGRQHHRRKTPWISGARTSVGSFPADQQTRLEGPAFLVRAERRDQRLAPATLRQRLHIQLVHARTTRLGSWTTRTVSLLGCSSFQAILELRRQILWPLLQRRSQVLPIQTRLRIFPLSSCQHSQLLVDRALEANSASPVQAQPLVFPIMVQKRTLYCLRLLT